VNLQLTSNVQGQQASVEDRRTLTEDADNRPDLRLVSTASSVNRCWSLDQASQPTGILFYSSNVHEPRLL